MGFDDLAATAYLREKHSLENLEALELIHGGSVVDVIDNSLGVFRVHASVGRGPVDDKAHGVGVSRPATMLHSQDITGDLKHSHDTAPAIPCEMS